MRFASQRFERFFQRIEGGAGPGQHLLAFVQQMQFVQAQGADNHDLAIVIIAVGGRTFGQAGVGRLHQNNFIGVYAGVEHAPEFQQGAGKDNRQGLALTGAEAFAVALGFCRVGQQMRRANQARQVSQKRFMGVSGCR